MGADVFCQGCGTSIDSEARFCGECGTRQEAVSATGDAILAATPTETVASLGDAAPMLGAAPAPLVERAAAPVVRERPPPEPDVPEAGLPMYRPRARDGAPLRPTSPALSTAKAAARGVGAAAEATGSMFGFVFKWGLTALWAVGSVLVISHGQVLPGLAGLIYVTYLVCGGRWLIW